MAENVARVHTHTHTSDLINKKESIENALLMIHIAEQLLI